MKNSDYFSINDKIRLLQKAEQNAEDPDMKNIWASKIHQLREKLSIWLIAKSDELKRKKGE